MSQRTRSAVLVLGLATCIAAHGQAQRVGESATVQFGTVLSAQPVELTSDAARGAVVGGMVGLATAGGRSRGRAVRNGILGAGAGSAVAAAAEGDRSGMSYTVRKLDGSSTTVVTDQREIQVGDCVAIERVGSTANIRRASASYCQPANDEALSSIESDTQEDAVKCAAAKQEYADAQSDGAADLARRRIELLCNG